MKIDSWLRVEGIIVNSEIEHKLVFNFLTKNGFVGEDDFSLGTIFLFTGTHDNAEFSLRHIYDFAVSDFYLVNYKDCVHLMNIPLTDANPFTGVSSIKCSDKDQFNDIQTLCLQHGWKWYSTPHNEFIEYISAFPYIVFDTNHLISREETLRGITDKIKGKSYTYEKFMREKYMKRLISSTNQCFDIL